MLIKYISLLAILMHGLGHGMGMMPGWVKDQTTLLGTPWLIPFTSPMAKVWGFMWFGVLMLFMIALGGMLFKTTWWPTWLIIAAIGSLIVIAPWWNTMPIASKIGAVGVDLLILYMLLGPMRETVLSWFR